MLDMSEVTLKTIKKQATGVFWGYIEESSGDTTPCKVTPVIVHGSSYAG